MKSYKPDELFDENGALVPGLRELPPKGDRRMGANPHANGGLLLKELRMPDFRDYGVNVPQPGAAHAEPTRVLGYRIQKYIGAYAAALEGVDAIVFTAGIGENSPSIRGEVLRPFRYLGLRIDEQKNQEGQTVFSRRIPRFMR